jgi:hypothetical protein
MTICRYDTWSKVGRKHEPRLWFAWYPCWIYEAKGAGADIAWVWLEWVQVTKANDGSWMRDRVVAR